MFSKSLLPLALLAVFFATPDGAQCESHKNAGHKSALEKNAPKKPAPKPSATPKPKTVAAAKPVQQPTSAPKAAEPSPLAGIIAHAPAGYFPPFMDSAVKQFAAGNYDGSYATLQTVEAASNRRQPLDKLYLLEALALQAQGKDTDALKDFKRSLDFRGASSDTRYFLVLSLTKLSDADDEQAAAKRAAILEEANFFNNAQLIPKEHIMVELARAYLDMDQNTKAQTLLNTVVAADPAAVEARVQLARAVTDRATQLKYLEDALAQPNGQNPDVKITLIKTLLTDVDRLTDSRDVTQARALAEGLKEDPALPAKLKPDVAALIIRSQIAASDLVAAEKSLGEASRAYPTNAEWPRLKQQLIIEKASAAALAPTPTATPAAEDADSENTDATGAK